MDDAGERCMRALNDESPVLNGEALMDLAGASSPDVVGTHAGRCKELPGHVYTMVTVAWRVSSLHPQPQEEVGVCLPEYCLAGAAADRVKKWLEKLIVYRCRDGHPSLRYFWPSPDYWGSTDKFRSWFARAVERFDGDGDVMRFLAWGAITECPAAACAVLGMTLIERADMQDQQAGLREMVDVCYEELLGDVSQLQLFGRYGFNLGILEITAAQIRADLSERTPRNPHHDDGRLVWRDYYSGLYPPVNYSQQFDLQWRLALEEPDSDFGQESSTRLDDCALNDMIESTFGARDHLEGCTPENRTAHEEKERGISQRNWMFLDLQRVRGADVLDVGCGFGRWTAMMTRLGANVTSVDASDNAVRSTRRYNPDRVFQMSLFDLPSLPNFEAGWEYVICWGVMQHTHDPLRAFKTVASALREGGYLFIQVYNDHSKAAYPFVQRLRGLFHRIETVEERVEFLRKTAAAAGADVFDHLDGMLTFYNWAVHEETVRQWFLDNGFPDYWRVWNYKYMGRKRQLERPVRDDYGTLLRPDLGEAQSGVTYYPVVGHRPG